MNNITTTSQSTGEYNDPANFLMLENFEKNIHEYRQKIKEISENISKLEICIDDSPDSIETTPAIDTTPITEKKISKFQNFCKNIFNFFLRIFCVNKKEDLAKNKQKIFNFDELKAKHDQQLKEARILSEITKIQEQRDFYAFKFIVNYRQYYFAGGNSLRYSDGNEIKVDEINEYFRYSENFLQFFSNPRNLTSDHQVSKEELGMFISYYRYYYHISNDGESEIVNENFANVNKLYLNAIDAIDQKDHKNQKFLEFQNLATRLSNSISYNANSVDIALFKEIQKEVHDYVDNKIVLPGNELDILKNYIITHNALNSLGRIQYDVNIKKIADKIQSIKSRNAKENLLKSITSRNAFFESSASFEINAELHLQKPYEDNSPNVASVMSRVRLYEKRHLKEQAQTNSNLPFRSPKIGAKNSGVKPLFPRQEKLASNEVLV